MATLVRPPTPPQTRDSPSTLTRLRLLALHLSSLSLLPHPGHPARTQQTEDSLLAYQMEAESQESLLGSFLLLTCLLPIHNYNS